MGFVANYCYFLVSLMGYITFTVLESLLLEAKFLKNNTAALRVEEHDIRANS